MMCSAFRAYAFNRYILILIWTLKTLSIFFPTSSIICCGHVDILPSGSVNNRWLYCFPWISSYTNLDCLLQWMSPFHFFFFLYLSIRSPIASSSREPKDLSVSTARCFKSLIQSESILVENTFFLAIIRILRHYSINYNKDNQYELII